MQQPTKGALATIANCCCCAHTFSVICLRVLRSLGGVGVFSHVVLMLLVAWARSQYWLGGRRFSHAGTTDGDLPPSCGTKGAQIVVTGVWRVFQF